MAPLLEVCMVLRKLVISAPQGSGPYVHLSTNLQFFLLYLLMILAPVSLSFSCLNSWRFPPTCRYTFQHPTSISFPWTSLLQYRCPPPTSAIHFQSHNLVFIFSPAFTSWLSDPLNFQSIELCPVLHLHFSPFLRFILLLTQFKFHGQSL